MKKTIRTQEALEITASILRKQLREVEKELRPIQALEHARKKLGLPGATALVAVTRTFVNGLLSYGIKDQELFSRAVSALDESGLTTWPTHNELRKILWRRGVSLCSPEGRRTNLWDGKSYGSRLVAAA